jgi:hypothetical protein
MLNILGHKGNVNQNYIEIPPLPSQNDIFNNNNNNECWQGCREKEHFYTVGGNVN